jgi:hypothetical protein
MKTTIDMAETISHGWWLDDEKLKAFEALVRADEREACAQIAADYGPSRPIVSKNPSSQIVGRWEGEQAASAAIDAAIRNRGNT